VIRKICACVAAVAVAATITLATLVALVQGTILAVSLPGFPLRLLAVLLALVVGTILLVACIYLATRLAVRIVGVGDVEFPPLPELSGSADEQRSVPPDAQPSKN
jgi:hypothetical protein